MISCQRTTVSPSCQWVPSPPSPVFFEIEKNGQFVNDSHVLSSVKINYYQNGVEEYINDLTISDTITTGKVVNRVLFSENLAEKSADGGIKTFYIEYPSSLGIEDTLYIDFSTFSPSNGCQYVFNKLEFNNHVPPINLNLVLPDTADHVYIFKK